MVIRKGGKMIFRGMLICIKVKTVIKGRMFVIFSLLLIILSSSFAGFQVSTKKNPGVHHSRIFYL
jgi:hypothetical protein